MQQPNKNGDVFPDLDYGSLELKIIRGRLQTGISAVDVVFGGGIPIKNPCGEIYLGIHDECVVQSMSAIVDSIFAMKESSILDDVVILRMSDDRYQALDKDGELIALVTFETAQFLVKRGVGIEPSCRKQFFKMMNFTSAYGK